ncbi:hypothetical protein ONS95_001565 [Cadophora gregata]|uniref:uncharacterized protein n=1 Tax=Cadophora gregata TaxID=51156 RepID=UPI0026DAE102|nr:uncharacterized protein ONS95_001565 [Cadophora gregata]KAK0111189.1 hypothetical protein ONS95_001565 [Cadophora gregata]KAK0112340.1 hypothetical protein ONS96_001587 [Cadophora gregata f. sp. sojae]
MLIMFPIPTFMTMLLIFHAIQATNNTERSSARTIPVFSTEEAASSQNSNLGNQPSSILQPDAQASDVNCPSNKPSCEATDCDGDATEFRCRASGTLQTCPCCPQSELPSCNSQICMAQLPVLLCTITLLQDCPCEYSLEPVYPLHQYTDVPFSTDEELRQTQLEFQKLFEERPELRPLSKEWYEKRKREGRPDQVSALDGSSAELGTQGALGLDYESLQRGVFAKSSGGSLLLSLKD